MHLPKMGEGDDNSSSSRCKTKRPSFFKVLVGDFTNQLRIPRAFLNHFNGKLPEVSILKSPTGRYWLVKMKKVEKDLVFRDGWERFVKEHSLQFGDFLVFRYSGKCKFKVKIYARNACEKEIVLVPSKRTNVESNSQKKKQKVDVATEKCTKFPSFDGKCGGVKENKKKAVSNKTTTRASVKPKRVHVMEFERKAALDQYNSEFSCFTAACSHFRNHHMTLPKKVVEENGLMNKANLQLSDPHGRLWPVTVTHRMDGRVDLRGCSEFWKGNNLAAGDTCGFKFNKDLGNVVYMEIFRAKKLVKPISQCLKPSLMLTCTPNVYAIQATGSREGSDSIEIKDVSPIRPTADSIKEDIDENEGQHSSKMKRLTPRSRLRYLLRSFERKVTRPTSDSLSRCSTQVKSSPKRDRNSTKNMEAFSTCQVTQSTESDGCDSPLQEESSDHVPISRSSYSTMFFRKSPVTTLMTRVARDFKSDNPFYIVIMRPSYVNKPFKSNVPSYFARKYFKQDLCLTLRFSDGRSWPVQCVSVKSNAKLNGGWRNFVKENHLKEGDVCVFELVKRRNVEMNVVICRDRSEVVKPISVEACTPNEDAIQATGSRELKIEVID